MLVNPQDENFIKIKNMTEKYFVFKFIIAFHALVVIYLLEKNMQKVENELLKVIIIKIIIIIIIIMINNNE